ncbi:MAG: protoporphyrinogen oxidase [Nitrospinae bacterium]|nr:protoporphyrinogen oxidase [Nitrospinota bacterium]MEC4670817.1 protoporphyrinogen oxidase [Nitrospirota bacterium]
MSSLPPSPKRVVIIGGGIAGLSTAFALDEHVRTISEKVDCTLVEAQQTWGGKIVTNRVEGLVIEGGPDSFLTSKPWGLELCEKLGLTSQLINTNEAQSRTYTYSQGKLRQFPQGLVALVPTRLGPLFWNGLLSWPGILRMAGDWVIPARRDVDQDESLAAFFRRRVGREAFDRLIEPLVAGIYAGDAEELSVVATFPRFVELEERYGGLIRGMLAQRKATRNSSAAPSPQRTMFTTLRGGMGDLVMALVEALSTHGVTLQAGRKAVEIKVSALQKGMEVYDITLDDGCVLQADGVVLANPAYSAAELVRPLKGSAADLLERIPYASTATVSMAFRRSEVESLLQGFGFVVPRVEGRNLIAATWTSCKWSGRATPELALVRCYLGGRGREAVITLDDEELVHVVRKELKFMVRILAAPVYTEVYRWKRGMPQYTLGHLDRLEDLRSSLAEYPGLFLTGSAYEGVGIPDCIRDASRTVKKLAHYLWKSPPSSC